MEKVRQEADAADEADENEDPDAQQDYKDFKAWLDQSVAEGGSTVKLVGQKVVKIDKPVDTPNPPTASPLPSASAGCCALCKKPNSECSLFDQLYHWMI